MEEKPSRRSAITDDGVLELLAALVIQPSGRRVDVLPSGTTEVQILALGVVADAAVFTRATTSYLPVVEVLAKWLRQDSALGDLEFTSIQVDKDFACRVHRDSGSAGPRAGAVSLTVTRASRGDARRCESAGDAEATTENSSQVVSRDRISSITIYELRSGIN